jgi:hypothetical protein
MIGSRAIASGLRKGPLGHSVKELRALNADVIEIEADHDLPLVKGAEYARLTRLAVERVWAGTPGTPYPATPVPGWTVCTDRICTEVIAQALAFRVRYRGLA